MLNCEIHNPLCFIRTNESQFIATQIIANKQTLHCWGIIRNPTKWCKKKIVFFDLNFQLLCCDSIKHLSSQDADVYNIRKYFHTMLTICVDDDVIKIPFHIPSSWYKKILLIYLLIYTGISKHNIEWKFWEGWRLNKNVEGWVKWVIGLRFIRLYFTHNNKPCVGHERFCVS